jgi:hypothetical protein
VTRKATLRLVLNLTAAVERKYFCGSLFATKYVNWPQVAVAPLFSRILLHYGRGERSHYFQFPSLYNELWEENSSYTEFMPNAG